MNLSVELQLLAVAIGLYVFDSMLLLFPNEGVLTSIGRNKWRIAFGSDNTRVRGKEILFPNLFLPHRPIFKLSWDYEGADPSKLIDIDWVAQKELFKNLTVPIYAIGFAQFILFPYVIFFFLTDLSIIIAIAYLYGSILIALIMIYRKRQIFHISKKKFYSLSFECLVCPPVAFNLVRKISLSLPVLRQDLLIVAQGLLEEKAWHVTKNLFISRLAEAIDFEDEGTQRHIRLNANRAKILLETYK